MKIIHISDLHYPHFKGTEELIDKIIKYYLSSELKPLVICTGDILDTPPPASNEKNYLDAKNMLLKLKENNFNILICPGNHDLKIDGTKKRKLISNNLKRFNHYYNDLLPKNTDYNNGDEISLLNYPIVHKFENNFFIGLNSMANNPKSSRGELGSIQRTKLKNELANIRKNYENPVITVYLHHNPLPFKVNIRKLPKIGDKIVTKNLRLKDREEFLEIIKDVNILLFGHLHWSERKSKYEKKHKINCIHLTGGSTAGAKEEWTEIDTITYEAKIIEK